MLWLIVEQVTPLALIGVGEGTLRPRPSRQRTSPGWRTVSPCGRLITVVAPPELSRGCGVRGALQVSHFCRCPVEGAERADAAGFAAEPGPGGTAGVEDVIVGWPEAVREEALAQVEPDPLDGVELGGVGRQEDRGEVGRDRQSLWRYASRHGPR